jgi:SOS response regulatory protein OraA/RecX
VSVRKKVSKMTAAQRYAIESAKSYLSFMAFSKEGLKSQLRYEKYSEKDAQYAVDHCGADWYEQAYKCAKGYMEDNSLSRSELIDQLIYEGYSPEQAIYGVNRVFR